MSPPRFSADGAPQSHGDSGSDVREWLSVLLPLLGIATVIAGFWLLWQAMLIPPPTIAPISPMQIAADYSVSPVSFTSTATLPPMIVIVVTPPETPTPAPIGWQTATAEVRLTAEATLLPQPCPTTKEVLDAMTPGTLCRQPTATSIPAPTSSPIAGCDPSKWVPGELCEVGAPFAPTPTLATNSDGS